MLASFPVSMLNQKPSDLGIPNRFKLDPSRSSCFSIQPFATMPATVCFPTGCSFFEGQPSRMAHLLQCSSLSIVGNVLGARRHYFPFVSSRFIAFDRVGLRPRLAVGWFLLSELNL